MASLKQKKSTGDLSGIKAAVVTLEVAGTVRKELEAPLAHASRDAGDIDAILVRVLREVERVATPAVLESMNGSARADSYDIVQIAPKGRDATFNSRGSHVLSTPSRDTVEAIVREKSPAYSESSPIQRREETSLAPPDLASYSPEVRQSPEVEEMVPRSDTEPLAAVRIRTPCDPDVDAVFAPPPLPSASATIKTPYNPSVRTPCEPKEPLQVQPPEEEHRKTPLPPLNIAAVPRVFRPPPPPPPGAPPSRRRAQTPSTTTPPPWPTENSNIVQIHATLRAGALTPPPVPQEKHLPTPTPDAPSSPAYAEVDRWLRQSGPVVKPVLSPRRPETHNAVVLQAFQQGIADSVAVRDDSVMECRLLELQYEKREALQRMKLLEVELEVARARLRDSQGEARRASVASSAADMEYRSLRAATESEAEGLRKRLSAQQSVINDTEGLIHYQHQHVLDLQDKLDRTTSDLNASNSVTASSQDLVKELQRSVSECDVNKTRLHNAQREAELVKHALQENHEKAARLQHQTEEYCKEVQKV